jgi:hypothetical protein
MAEELHRGVGANIVHPPEITALLPQDRHGRQVGTANKLLDTLKVFLRSNTDNLQDILVISSELLDV